MPAQSALTKRPPARATYRDVLDAPPHKVAEILSGNLYMNPRPAMPHSRATSALHLALAIPHEKGLGGPGGWTFYFEPELHLGDEILVPDLAAWRLETMPNDPQGPYATVSPDWVCETLSPSTRRMDVSQKRDIYARHGLEHLWFLDPDNRTLEAFELLDNGHWQLLSALDGDDDVSVPPFDSASFSLGDLWPRNGPPPTQ